MSTGPRTRASIDREPSSARPRDAARYGFPPPTCRVGGPHDGALALQASAGNQATEALLGPRAGAVTAGDSSGQPLALSLRSEMEERLGHDFSRVRVHTGSDAARSAAVLHAKAYTVGQDIVFAEGRFSPGTLSGRRLLAHELAHVVQQGRGGRPPSFEAGNPLDQAADAAAARATQSSAPGAVAVAGTSGIGIARAEDEGTPWWKRRLNPLYQKALEKLPEPAAQRLEQVNEAARRLIRISGTRDEQLDSLTRAMEPAIQTADVLLSTPTISSAVGVGGTPAAGGTDSGGATPPPAAQKKPDQRAAPVGPLIKGAADAAWEEIKSNPPLLIVQGNPFYNMYRGYKTISGLYDVYKQYGGGATGAGMAAEQMNPAYHVGTEAWDASEAWDRGDVEGAGRHGAKAIKAVVDTVMFARGLAELGVRPQTAGAKTTNVEAPGAVGTGTGAAKVEPRVGYTGDPLVRQTSAEWLADQPAFPRSDAIDLGSSATADPLQLQTPSQWLTAEPYTLPPDALQIRRGQVPAQWRLTRADEGNWIQFSPSVNPRASWRSAYRFAPPEGGGAVRFGDRQYVFDAGQNLVEASTTKLSLGVRDPVMYANAPGLQAGQDFGHLLGPDFGHIDAQLGIHGGFPQTSSVNRPLGGVAPWYNAERMAKATALGIDQAGGSYRVVTQAQGHVTGVPAQTRIFVESGGRTVYDSGWIDNPAATQGGPRTGGTQ